MCLPSYCHFEALNINKLRTMCETDYDPFLPSQWTKLLWLLLQKREEKINAEMHFT